MKRHRFEWFDQSDSATPRYQPLARCDPSKKPRENQAYVTWRRYLKRPRNSAVGDVKAVAVALCPGAGFTQPVASNDTEKGWIKNRRVELVRWLGDSQLFIRTHNETLSI